MRKSKSFSLLIVLSALSLGGCVAMGTETQVNVAGTNPVAVKYVSQLLSVFTRSCPLPADSAEAIALSQFETELDSNGRRIHYAETDNTLRCRPTVQQFRF